MPSCAVKFCKNNSKVKKKSEGITFHLFPTKGETKNEWVAAIRKSRNEPQWQPSTSSVVCSDHFHDSDLYITSRGLRRVNRKGYPKKELSDSTNVAVTSTALFLSSDVVLDNTAMPCTSPASTLLEPGPGSIKILKTESLEAPTTSSAVGASSSKDQENEDSDDDPLHIPRCASPSGLSDIGSSDLEGALDTPAILFLKKQLRENEEKLKEKEEKLREKEDKLREKEEKLREKEEQLREKDGKIESLQKANKRLFEKNTTLKLLLAKMKRKLLMMKRKTKDDSDDQDLDHSEVS